AEPDELARRLAVEVLDPRLEVDQQAGRVVAVVHAVGDVDGDAAQRVDQLLEDVDVDDRVVLDGHAEYRLDAAAQALGAAVGVDGVHARHQVVEPDVARDGDHRDVVVLDVDVEDRVGVRAVGAGAQVHRPPRYDPAPLAVDG